MRIKINFKEANVVSPPKGLIHPPEGEIEDNIDYFDEAVRVLLSKQNDIGIDCGGNVRISVSNDSAKIYQYRISSKVGMKVKSRKILADWLQQKIGQARESGSNPDETCKTTLGKKAESKPGEWKILTWSLQVGQTGNGNSEIKPVRGKAWSEEIVKKIVKKHDVCFFQEVLIGETEGINLANLRQILESEGFDCYLPEPMANQFTLLTAVRNRLINGNPEIIPIPYKCEGWSSCYTRALILKYNDVQLVNVHLPADRTRRDKTFEDRKNDRVELMGKVNEVIEEKFTWLAGDFNCADSKGSTIADKLDCNLKEAECLLSKIAINKLSIHKNVLKTSYHRWYNDKIKQKQIDYICSSQVTHELKNQKMLCCTVFGLKKPWNENEGVHNPVSNIFWKENTCIHGSNPSACTIDDDGAISFVGVTPKFEWKQLHLSHQDRHKAFQIYGDIRKKGRPWPVTGSWSWTW